MSKTIASLRTAQAYQTRGRFADLSCYSDTGKALQKAPSAECLLRSTSRSAMAQMNTAKLSTVGRAAGPGFTFAPRVRIFRARARRSGCRACGQHDAAVYSWRIPCCCCGAWARSDREYQRVRLIGARSTWSIGSNGMDAPRVAGSLCKSGVGASSLEMKGASVVKSTTVGVDLAKCHESA